MMFCSASPSANGLFGRNVIYAHTNAVLGLCWVPDGWTTAKHIKSWAQRTDSDLDQLVLSLFATCSTREPSLDLGVVV